jgi:hypothetical protein
MFNFLKKKKSALPPFKVLATHPYKDKYFYRVAPWRYLDNHGTITITDPNQPRMLTLDPWPQLVFLDAKGSMSVGQYVEHMATLYTSPIPANLDEAIIETLDILLLKAKLIKLSDTPVQLDPANDKAS